MPNKLTPAPAKSPATKPSPDAPTPSTPAPLSPEQQRQVGGGGLSPRPLPKGGW